MNVTVSINLQQNKWKSEVRVSEWTNECNYPIWHIKLWDNNNNNDNDDSNNSSTNALNIRSSSRSSTKDSNIFTGAVCLCMPLILTFMHTLFDRTDHNLVTYVHKLYVVHNMMCLWSERLCVCDHTSSFATNGGEKKHVVAFKQCEIETDGRIEMEIKTERTTARRTHTHTVYLSYLIEDKMKNRWHLLKVICECACSIRSIWWENKGDRTHHMKR